MSLQLVLGSSGSGKSYDLYHNIIENSLKHRERNYLVVVPEQFTMQTQKDLVSMHPNKGIMNIDILSFPRLAYRVFDELGGNQRLILEDTGKNMIIRKIMEYQRDDLILFGNNAKKQGFINEIKSMLSELFQYSISEEKLTEMVEVSSKKPMLQTKLKDMLLIYQGFREFLSEKYITTEEILDVLYEVVDQSKLLKDSVICLDGFTGFTPSQYKMLGRLMKLSKKVMIAITIDPREDINKTSEEFKLFYLSKTTIHKLYDIAKEGNIPIEEPHYSGSSDPHSVPYRYLGSKALASLEQNLYRYPFKMFREEQDDIQIFEIQNAEREVSFVGKEIRRLIQEEQYRYKDIAVVTGDIERYGRVIEKEFPEFGIPFFIDHKKGILTNPCIEFLRAALDIAKRNFSYESVFRFLRCGLLDLEAEEIDQLENYVLAFGIRGYKKWSETWNRTKLRRKEWDLDPINEIRENIMIGLTPVYQTLTNKKNTVRDFTQGIYELMVHFGVEKKIENYSEKFRKENELLLDKEYQQVYQIVIDLLDKMVDLLGEEKMPVREYSEILEAVFDEAKVGLIPPGIDQIVVGDIERTRLKDIKALFFLGVNDGIIPKASGTGGILSDADRELLRESKVELAPTKRQNVFTEQFYIYINLTKPQKLLYLTYSRLGSDGKALRPSQLIGTMRKLFPNIEVKGEDQYGDQIENIISEKKGINYFIKGLREYEKAEMPDVWNELMNWYFKQESMKPYVEKLIDGAFYTSAEQGLSKAIAEVLYGKELTNSVTRLEKYAACAFAHFLNYGLELQERQTYQLAVPDIGNIFHSAIDLFSKKLTESEYDWHTITDDMREKFVKESVEEAATEFGSTILKSSKRNEYMITRVERITKRTIWALCEHVRSGKFKPSGFELQFSYMDNLDAINVSLSDKENMQLRGRIDRVDTFEEEDKLYVKVIDYKSGSTSFDLVSLYYGLQMQLIVYLNAALELEERQNPDKVVIPAGIFYYNIEDPMIDKNIEYNRFEDTGLPDDVMEKVNEELLKELKMNGIVNSNMDIVKHMDQNLVNDKGELRTSVKSSVIPVELNKDGFPTKRSSIATEKQFKGVSSYVRNMIQDIGREILDGETVIEPYRLGEKTACDYCPYSGVCGFDTKLPGNQYRNLKKLDKDQVWELILSKEEES